jgi:ABC-type sugar transport system ATPase subunit
MVRPDKPVIEMRGIVKEFPGVRALSDLSFDVYKGEVHCLVGENGAGKSTLMKILSGAHAPTHGAILIDGKEYRALTPSLSSRLGIEIVYQENDLVPTMNAVENVFVGKEKTRFGFFIRLQGMLREVKSLMDQYHIDIDPLETIENMSVSNQQFVKILKALMNRSRILIMDEPTSMFNAQDANKVLSLVRSMSERGISIIYISHFLKEVVRIADRITVIRDGSVVRTYDNSAKSCSLNDITSDMVGRPVDMFYQRERCLIGEPVVEVEGLKLTRESPAVSFNVRRGEILGMFGMVGSGRTEIARAISGADRRHAGDVLVQGKSSRSAPRGTASARAFAHITEDRQRLGLNLSASVLENTLMSGCSR